MTTPKAVFNFWLMQWTIGNATIDQLDALVTKGTLALADSDEIQGCTALTWAAHKRI